MSPLTVVEVGGILMVEGGESHSNCLSLQGGTCGGSRLLSLSLSLYLLVSV